MDLDIMQMLAEPGQRQLVVASGAIALGAVKRIWKAYQIGRMDDPLYKISAYVDPSVRADARETVQKDKWFTRISWGLPTAIGLEEAVRSSSPVADSYVLEGASDIASGVGGYYAGKIGISLVVGGIDAGVKGAYNLLHREKATKE